MDILAKLLGRPSLPHGERLPEEVSCEEVQNLLRCEAPPVLLDVREPHELAEEGWIPGAVHIPMSEIESRLEELDRERPLVVYCAGGVRSRNVGAFLLAQGFSEVGNLHRGFRAWTGEVAQT